MGTSNSIVICINPLTSLMMDQQHKYSACLSTEFVGECQANPEVTHYHPIEYPYERILSRNASSNKNLVALVVD